MKKQLDEPVAYFLVDPQTGVFQQASEYFKDDIDVMALYSEKHIQFTKEQREELNDKNAYLRTLANFGGTLEQAKELAQKALDKWSGENE